MEKVTSVLLPRVIAIHRKVGHLRSMCTGLIFLQSFQSNEFSKSNSYFLLQVSVQLKAGVREFFLQGNVCFVNPIVWSCTCICCWISLIFIQAWLERYRNLTEEFETPWTVRALNGEITKEDVWLLFKVSAVQMLPLFSFWHVLAFLWGLCKTLNFSEFIFLLPL